MTNQQKDECRWLARETKKPAAEIAAAVGCSNATASRYIKTFRKNAKPKRRGS